MTARSIACTTSLLTLRSSSKAKSSWLVFNGLDTFTTIEICGQIVGTTDNQFRQYTFDISEAIKDCQEAPTLSLNFGSAPKIANEIAKDPSAASKCNRTFNPRTIPNNQQSGHMAPNKFTNSRTDGISARSNLTSDGTGVQPLPLLGHGGTPI